MLGKLISAIKMLRRHGVKETWKYGLDRGVAAYFEWRLGISTMTKGPVYSNLDWVRYGASDYGGLARVLRALGIRPGEDVFLDFGSGLGRAVIMAARHPFRRVIGVEVSPELSAVAAENVVRARPRLRCKDINLVTADATSYPIPADVSIIYFYNPFKGEVLQKVLENIRQSLTEAPRPMRVVFKNVTYLEGKVGKPGWMTQERVVRSMYEHNYIIYRAACGTEGTGGQAGTTPGGGADV